MITSRSSRRGGAAGLRPAPPGLHGRQDRQPYRRISLSVPSRQQAARLRMSSWPLDLSRSGTMPLQTTSVSGRLRRRLRSTIPSRWSLEPRGMLTLPADTRPFGLRLGTDPDPQRGRLYGRRGRRPGCRWAACRRAGARPPRSAGGLRRPCGRGSTAARPHAHRDVAVSAPCGGVAGTFGTLPGVGPVAGLWLARRGRARDRRCGKPAMNDHPNGHPAGDSDLLCGVRCRHPDRARCRRLVRANKHNIDIIYSLLNIVGT